MPLLVDLTNALPTESQAFRIFLSLGTALAVLIAIAILRRDPRRKRLPPGPPGHWLWRNTFDLDGKSGDNR
jgi:hypothetical protein